MPRTNEADQFPLEGSDADYTTEARILGGEELVREIGLQRYRMLTRDIHVYGKQEYSVYAKGKTETIGFIIETSRNIGNQIVVTGKFGSSKDKIELWLTELDNRQIETEIRNITRKETFKNELPSNTKINHFISRLPITNDGYYIDYDPAKDGITVFLDERNPDLADRALAYISEQIGEPAEGNNRISISFPSADLY